MSTAPIKRETKKVCKHTLGELGCRFGDACHDVHPVDLSAAKAEWAAKKTLNICGFYPSCTLPACTFLHVAATPKSGASASAPARTSVVGKMPARPARTDDKRKSAAPSKSRRPAHGSKPRDELEAFKVLHRLRGKVNAINRAEMAYRELHRLIGDDVAIEKADKAKQMQVEILTKLKQFGESIDAYITELGAKVTDLDLDPEDLSDGEDGEEAPEALTAEAKP